MSDAGGIEPTDDGLDQARVDEAGKRLAVEHWRLRIIAVLTELLDDVPGPQRLPYWAVRQADRIFLAEARKALTSLLDAVRTWNDGDKVSG